MKRDEQNPPCAACGMQTLKPNEYHPFAACLMHQTIRNAKVVRANLMAVVEYGRNLEKQTRTRRSAAARISAAKRRKQR